MPPLNGSAEAVRWLENPDAKVDVIGPLCTTLKAAFYNDGPNKDEKHAVILDTRADLGKDYSSEWGAKARK